MSKFNWPVLMRAGIERLRLTPEQFWQLTPGELRLLLGQGAGAGAMPRKKLDALVAAFPDTIKGEEPDGTRRDL